MTDAPPLFHVPTGIELRPAAKDGQPQRIHVDYDAGIVVLDATDTRGRRCELLMHTDDAQRLVDVLARHITEGRY